MSSVSPINGVTTSRSSAAGRKSRRAVVAEPYLAFDPRSFPTVADAPNLPLRIPDELLNYYAFVFCQAGFQQLGMTFEQFLLVVDVVKPPGLCAGRDDLIFANGARH